MIKKYKIEAGLAVFAVFVAFLGFFQTAHANPTYIATVTQTSATSTQPAFIITAPTASTTLVYDTYAKTTDGGLLTTAPTVAVGLNFSASSTSSIFGLSFQYSFDGIDWYNDDVNGGNILATTTPSNLASTNSYIFKAFNLASSTYMIVIKAPSRYVRAVFTVTGANGAVWAQFMPTKEVR